MADSDVLAALAADLIGADVGSARKADLERAVRAATEAAGERLDPAALARRLRAAPADDRLRRAFVGALTISETHFFRLRGQFDALEERVLPGLFMARRATRQLRLWSAGCSTGEEAWSLAILLERLLPAGWDATILATDVDEQALEHARRGVYRAHSFRDTPESVRARWFTATPDGWEVDERLRRRVRFAALNLVTGSYPSAADGTTGVDLLLCRNVLMYFTREARARAAGRLSACLAPGGWLAIAPAELSPGAFPDLAVRHFPAAILHQRPDPALPAPATPPGRPPAKPPAAERPTQRPASERLATERLATARALADQGETAEAERLLAEVLEADPLLAEARELRALLLLDRGGDDEGAESELRAALFLEPDRALAQATLSALLARRGDSIGMSQGEGHVERVLAERARLLARPLEEPGVEGTEVVVLEGGGERYAVGLAWVERVHPVDAVTPLPGLRPPWAGLISLRGELLPALDLPSYLGRASPAAAGRAVGCAVVTHGGLRVAFLSEAPITLVLCPEGSLSPPAPTTAPAGAVVGVTDDLVNVLHVPTILADAALVVDD